MRTAAPKTEIIDVSLTYRRDEETMTQRTDSPILKIGMVLPEFSTIRPMRINGVWVSDCDPKPTKSVSGFHLLSIMCHGRYRLLLDNHIVKNHLHFIQLLQSSHNIGINDLDR